jgi:hypothetical protein
VTDGQLLEPPGEKLIEAHQGALDLLRAVQVHAVQQVPAVAAVAHERLGEAGIAEALADGVAGSECRLLLLPGGAG